MLPEPKLALAAVDSSADAEAAVAWLATQLPQHQLRVLMCVVEQGGSYAGAQGASEVEAAKAACKARFPQAQAAEVVVAASGSSDAIGAAILNKAAELGASLVALAPHSRTATQRVLQGSVTDYCCRHARVPVLVVQGVVGGKEREA